MPPKLDGNYTLHPHDAITESYALTQKTCVSARFRQRLIKTTLAEVRADLSARRVNGCVHLPYDVVVSQASRIFPRVRMRAVISGRRKGRKNTSGHSRQVFWSPTQNRVDQSGASYHVITRIFHVITYAVGNRFLSLCKTIYM